MQTLNLRGLNQMLHSTKSGGNNTERIMTRLSQSNLGLQKNTSSSSTGYDSFSITENISELLSPACGMTDEEKESYLAKIMAKLKSGKKLSSEEMRFLQAENPELYQQAARIQAMRESLETRLQHATSKENASNIYADALSNVSDKDPMKEYIVAAYDDAMKEFQKSDEYQNLPATEEEAKEEEARKKGH